MIVRVLLGLVSAVALIGVLGYLALAHPAANRYLADKIGSMAGPELTLEEVTGSLLGELCVAHASYRHERVTILAESLCLRVNLWQSFDYLSVSLESLNARLLEIQTQPARDNEEHEGGFELPVPVAVTRVEVAALTVDGVSATGLRASLDLSNQDLNSITRFSLLERDWRLDTSGSWKALNGTVATGGIELVARVDLTGSDLPYEVKLSASRLELAELIDRDLVLEELSLSGEGSTAGYRFHTGFNLSDPLGRGSILATAEGDWSHIALSSVSIEHGSLPGLGLVLDKLTGTAALGWTDGWQLTLEELVTRGSLQGQALRATLDVAQLDEQGVQLEGGTISPGGGPDASHGELRADGYLGMDQSLDLRLAGKDLPLELIDERIGGRAAAEMSLTGTFERPLLDGSFVIDAGSYEELTLGTISGELRGALDEGQLILALESSELTLDTEVAYRLQPDRQLFSISKAMLVINSSPAGRLRAVLMDPVAVTYSENLATFPESCVTVSALDFPDAQVLRICGGGSYPEGPIQVRLPIWQFPESLIPDTRVSLTGNLAADATMATFDPAVGSVRMRFTELVAHHQDVTPVSLGDVQLELNVRPDEAELRIDTPAEQALVLDGAFAAQLGPELLESPLAGQISLALDGIWLAEALLPMDVAFELDRIRGQLTMDAEVSGTLGEPEPRGRLALVDAGWEVVAVNTAFDDFDLSAQIMDTDRIAFESRGLVGGGSLTANGELDLVSERGASLTTSFAVDDARVVDLPDYSVTIGGAVNLQMTSDALVLGGELAVPRALFRIVEVPETAEVASDDEVLIQDSAVSAQQVRSTDISVKLGEGVELDAFGLQTRLTGHLRLREVPGQARELTGLINLREGRFEAYGQSLTVDRGQLTFTGPPEDPMVDVVATKIVTYQDRDYRISLLIEGTAQNLITTLRSSPALADDDALALLITGRTFSQISSTEQSNVSGAALSLGLLSATGITGNLATTLGLEEIIVDQDAQGNMEVGAAVRLNRDVYLRYTYGVFSRLGGVLLRYRLNSRFSVQAKTGDAHSIELRYGVDD